VLKLGEVIILAHKKLRKDTKRNTGGRVACGAENLLFVRGKGEYGGKRNEGEKGGEDMVQFYSLELRRKDII